MIEIRDFTKETICEAVELFVHSFNDQRKKIPLIPERKALSSEISSALSRQIDRPGVSAYQDGMLAGYMVETGVAEAFMGKRTAFSLDLYSHCSVEFQEERIYQEMYERLSGIWVEKGYHTQVISFWAQDSVLLYTLFKLGFGMTHFDLLRDLSLPENTGTDISIHRLDSTEPLMSLYEEEPNYYRKPPLFWLIQRDEQSKDKIEADGDVLAAFDGDEPVAYFHMKKNKAETWLIADEETGCIAGAYAAEKYRKKGIGTLLLREAVAWAKENGLKRLYVEGESANIQGGNFWMKHFTPVAYSVRRCIDERITDQKNPGLSNKD